MSLGVNTNVSSLTAHRSLAKNETMMNQAMTRLSTGLKINSASDDAAGLAIVERMKSQINGLNMAVKNANDGIGLTKSVEGALVEVTDMLQRLRELAVQSANDTNSVQDRIYIQEEVQLLLAEIDRVSTNTRYNGTKVLDGNFTSKNLQVGTEGGEVITFSLDNIASASLGEYKWEATGKVPVPIATSVGANTTTTSEVLTIAGYKATKTFTPAAGDSAKAFATGINNLTADTGVTAEARTYAILDAVVTTDAIGSFKIGGGVGVTAKSTGNFTWANGNVTAAVKAINDISQYTGVTAQAFNSNTQILLLDADGDDITLENETTVTTSKVSAALHDGSAAKSGGTNTITFGSSAASYATRVSGTLEMFSTKNFQVSTAGNVALTYFGAGAATAAAASIDATSDVNLKTAAGAKGAIRVLDGAIEKISSMRAELGAIENRLSHTVNNLMNVSEQTENTRSLLEDANFAVESSNLSKSQVLMQAATAMLAQANARPQLALQLLQG